MNKNTFFIIGVIMAITIVLTIATIHQGGGMDHQGGVSVASKEYSLSRGNEHNDILSSTSSTSKAKRISRFLKEEVKPKNPRAASHCNKNDNVCYAEGSPGTTCCNNKCVNLTSDSDNCGACKSKCKFYTETCCNGICVNLSYDKRHCGRCNNKCTTGGICLYGNCDYA